MSRLSNPIMLGIASILVVFGTAVRSEAGLTEVTSRAALNGTDLIDWGQLGPSGTQIPNPETVTTSGGIPGMVAQVSGNGERLDQGNGWGGNFADGDHLYYTQYNFNSTDQGPITITLNQGVMGIGTQLQENYYGTFTAFVNVYDTHGNFLGSFTEDGVSNANGDNSAIFLGVSSTSANIGSVEYGLTYGGNGSTADFAINKVSLASVPEPTSIALALSGLFAIAYAARRRGRKVAD